MSRASTSALRDGVILNNRYRVIRQLGRGGFGRAYLAEDIQRYRELCVLKEFAPQVEGDRELHQAEDLFEREAGILYKLNHSQIPRFEALLRTRIDGKRSLFLVQEYIEGKSFWQLLRRRGRLTETEVVSMIEEVLPVLDYIHDAGLIHRDISPDNLILRDLDRRPVLIDFGCVKLAANAVSQSRGGSLTLVGKKGYSADEQLSRGRASRSSDLYSLAATAIVLLSGKQPDELYDSRQGQWDWNQVEISSRLRKILRKMLAERPKDRYQSAEQVRQALLIDADDSVFSSFVSRLRTLIVAPGNQRKLSFPQFCSVQTIATGVTHQVSRIIRSPLAINHLRVRPWQWGMIAAAIVIIPGLISFTLINYRITVGNTFDLGQSHTSSHISQQEINLQQKIHRRVEFLNLDASAFYSQVDRVFHNQYPELVGVKLTKKSEHQKYRQIWYKIANTLLSTKERQR